MVLITEQYRTKQENQSLNIYDLNDKVVLIFEWSLFESFTVCVFIHSFADPDVTSRSTVRKENRIRQVPESPVAFLASLSEHAKNLGVNQTMIFDHATTNIGNAYNEHAGVFIAPVSGIYLFSTTIFIFPNINAHYELRRNGVLVTRMYLHGTESVYETASTTAVLQLSAGDDVTVVNVEGNKAVYGSHYSSFTGVFLQEFLDEELSVVG